MEPGPWTRGDPWNGVDHFVTKSGDDRRDESQAILALVRDQNTQMIGLAVTHLTPSVESSACTRPVRLSCPMVLGWILDLPQL